MDRKQSLYEALCRHGGRVGSRAEWRALGQRCGYTAYRDLAGFYGGRRPSMVRLADDSRQLTPDGWRRAG